MPAVAVVGSVAQDEVVWLRQPLRPGGHLDAVRRTLRLGGGGANTAIPLRHAGHRVALLAPIGGDPAGEWLIARLEAAGLDVSMLSRRPGESTRSLVLVDPDGERTIVNLCRCQEDGPPDRLAAIAADAVYVRSRDLELAPLLARCLGQALVVAHLPPLAAGLRPATVLVGSASDLPADVLADPWSAGREVAGDPLRWVVVTHGAQGAVAYGPGVQHRAAAPAVAVVDSTAAGDVFAAGLVHALVEGRPMEAALRLAVAWGATAVGCEGLPAAETIRSLSRVG